MADVIRIVDPADPWLSDYRDLTDVALRRKLEPAGGLFIAEGEKVIRRALAAGYQPRSMLVTPRWRAAMDDLVAGLDAPVLLADDDVLDGTTGYHVHRGALAAMCRRQLPSVAEVLSAAGQVVVLEDVNDHTNVGAVFRSAAALGMQGAILSPRCGDPLYRRAVKVSMGAVFETPYARMTRWPDGYDEIRRAGHVLIALTPSADAMPLDAVPRDALDRCALMIGSEGTGLTASALRAASFRVRIPMAPGIDSLNVAAAVAVACYVIRQGS